MDIRPIHTDEDNAAALRRIDALWGATPGTPEGDELDILIALVAHYEEGRWPTPRIGKPAEFLRGFMEMSGRTQGDLAALLARSRALPKSSTASGTSPSIRSGFCATGGASRPTA